jgi:hypothetical protein
MAKYQPTDTEIRPDPSWPDWLKQEFQDNQTNDAVGTKLLSVDRRVRVWHISIPPGGRLPCTATSWTTSGPR